MQEQRTWMNCKWMKTVRKLEKLTQKLHVIDLPYDYRIKIWEEYYKKVSPRRQHIRHQKLALFIKSLLYSLNRIEKEQIWKNNKMN